MSAPTLPRPASRARATPARLTGIDLARGFAVIGMVAVHSLVPYGDDDKPTFVYQLAAGRAAAVFAVLAGVTIAFLSGRTRQSRGAKASGISAALATRALIVAVIGFSLGYTNVDYGVVILPYYGAMFLLAIPLIYLPTRVIAALAVVNALLMPVASHLVRPYMSEGFTRQLSWETLLQRPLGTAAELFVTGEFPALIWMTYVCVGIVLGRADLRSTRVASLMVGIGAGLVAVATAGSWALLGPMGGLDHLVAVSGLETADEIIEFGGDGWSPTGTWWWLTVVAPHTGTSFDLAATVGSSLMLIGLCLLLFHLGRGTFGRVARVVTAPVVAVGTMSLTIYVAHIMFVNSDFDLYGPWEGYLRQLVVMALFAVAWRATAGRGPLEGFIRSITTRVRRKVEARSVERSASR